ncbi:hypothetical protein [Jeotgalibacillus proteolyticus]|uniref:Uncharacterized protein n=1 Tax=Jeotgalibacillus proteolyticus TaxID=2082395 RepID=A0A2S5GBQ6_9BACL|nr:hypothetical protein [Jeotgalibacillus proteolyticus]PPA70344.1 hypothetical protein C4B60_12255 [Jeotgalibacillus proteolyticus]
MTMRSPDIILGNGLVTESSSTSFPDESISLDGERVLASIYFTENKMISQALHTDFSTDVDEYLNELEKYEVAYLIKSDFSK